jgi:calmodulin
MWRLREILNAIGEDPTDEELFALIAEGDVDGEGGLTFPELLRIVQAHKSQSGRLELDQVSLDAWIALGGNPDKSGKVPLTALKVVAEDFELDIDVEGILRSQIEERLKGTLSYSSGKAIRISVPSHIDFDTLVALFTDQ